MKKTFTAFCALFLMSVSSMAQDNGKGLLWAAETGIGTELEVGMRGMYKFNKYLAWDILTLKYSFDYGNNLGDKNSHEGSITTGIRGFTPTFNQDKMRGFAALDLGYGADSFGPSDWNNNFVIDITIGAYVWKGLYVGYGLGLFHHDKDALPWTKEHQHDHNIRIGYSFRGRY